ncbi:type VI secretion system ImpA family N-terminal domain-containing protein [Silvanigrella aquatica]|uniref:ImpA N-terminal domain-containing protein n=1 Tax=Silvanigrella aquatica TaxID=1915309 RepID=A0A1L4CZ37_9BACT|nr:type VI secretion system ImpA family N-terminal domain-containing protein [Silvanigrella aquatica]APJ03195.1 hypothetical protein AXG55_04470 [Silvanigrella aquatica]
MANENQNISFSLTNLENLMSPISEENPYGENLKRHDIMLKLKDMRTQIFASQEEEGIWSKKNKELPSWQNIADLCEDILINYSKDFQVCAYYTETQLQLEGLPGLAKALSFLIDFCKEYWDAAFPVFNIENTDLRAVPFRWLQTHLPILINQTQLISSYSSEKLSWFWYESKLKVGMSEGADAKKIFYTAIENSENICSLYLSLEFIKASLSRLEEEYLYQLAGDEEDNLSFSDAIEVCENILAFLKPIYDKEEKNSFVMQQTEISSEAEDFQQIYNQSFENRSDASSILRNSNYSSGEFSSCEEAYKLIAAANQYLLKHDPHSPSPFLIRRGLEWRKKSLYGVLMELFTTTSKPQEIFTLLGLSYDDNKEQY